MIDQVTAVIINWRTLNLTLRCVDGLLNQYPNVRLVLIDNGSADPAGSAGNLAALAKTRANTSAILNQGNWCDRGLPMPPVGIRDAPYGVGIVLDTGGETKGKYLVESVLYKLYTGGNVGHGPALHQMLTLCKTPYMLALDSDCIVQRGGFIEGMLEPFSDSKVYAVGRQIKLDKRGTVQPPRERRKGRSHIHSSIVMLDVAKYRTLYPYVHHGVPSLLNMADAVAAGFKLVHYNIGPEGTEVHHLFRGSRKLTNSMPNVRSRPIMPRVLLDGLVSEFIGGYFDV